MILCKYDYTHVVYDYVVYMYVTLSSNFNMRCQYMHFNSAYTYVPVLSTLY